VKIGLRILLGYFLVVGLAGFFVMRVFVEQVKPGVRQAMEDTLVDTANTLAHMAADEMRDGRIADGDFARMLDRAAREGVDAEVWGVRRTRNDYRVYVTDVRGIVVYDSAGLDVGRDYSRWNDVYLTLRGRYGARSTRSDPDDESSTVMHVAAPIRDGERIIGVLTVAKPNSAMLPFIERSQAAILRNGALLMGLSLLIGLGVAWWLGRQLARLRGYAQAVTAGEAVAAPELGRNEFGELGRALETMRERLEGKQYVEQYVHTLTHELKSPLAAIRSSAELLQGDLPEADRRRFAEALQQQSQRLAETVERLLALATVEQRRGLSEAQPLALQALLDAALEAVGPALRARSLRLDGPGAVPMAQLRGDRYLLERALVNLLENAIAFAPAESAIELRLELSGQEIVLRIRDHGPGIPEFARERIFERFYSLPRPDGGARSSGLGLSFVREVTRLHGGRIRVANAEGGGAVAEWVLPRH
jgi:two-component system sensor histidine kinase CreC